MKKEMIEQIQQSKSKNDACLRVFGYCNKTSSTKLLSLIKEYNITVEGWDKKIKYCPECGTIVYKKGNKFCNRSCSAKFNNNKRPPMSYEQKEKTSKTLHEHFLKNKTSIFEYHNKKIVAYKDRQHTCLICNNILTLNQQHSYNIFCSNKCSAIWRSQQQSIRDKISKKAKERVANGTHKGWKTRNIISYPESFFIKVLDNNNIKYEHNFPLSQKSLGTENNNYYFLDFYIPNKKIDLEIDGNQHKDRISHDNMRDEILIKNGYKPYRIKWKCINTEKGKKYIQNEIENFLNFYNKHSINF